MAPFIGREPQLASLRHLWSHPSQATMSAVYGRRRIGKTRLVEEASRSVRMLRFEGLEGASSAQQRRHFRDSLYRQTQNEAHRMANTNEWSDLLLLLASAASAGGDEPTVVFFDEFQWMAAGRQELVGKLKYVWDNHIKDRSRVHLVLCGSVSSFLVRKVVRSRALYGRIDRVIDLGPLPFPEVAQGFFERRSPIEALEYYLLFGGVPRYLEMIDDRRSVRLNVEDLCFRPGSYFVDELDRLFVSHFGTNEHYRKIVEVLADKRQATRSQMSAALGLSSGGTVSNLFEDLRLAGFIEAYGPLHNPSSTHLRRYRLRDPFVHFYFRFIHSVRDRVTRSASGLPLHHALPDTRYNVYRGFAFEDFCRQHASLIAHKLGFSAVAYDAGSWFRRADNRSGAQIDLLFRRADRVVTLCEVKFMRHVGLEVVDEVERKVAALESLDHDAIERVLITARPPSKDLVDEGYFSRILTVDDLTGS